ncbi:restriction endonuclease subunit R [Pseudoprevotella muciniphila]|uniref:Restriction endonuclease subunit R n=1 Tax=Pseudoprevotella muciniphila TaxID=2133944 RepID=A0A5P8E9R1_9BACT|nr:restriction endonuclease subunit R [Pseudoprevotella muciniphila]
MTLKFKNQQFQTDAARAVTDVFRGQRNQAMVEFTHDMGRSADGAQDLFDVVGFRNQPVTVPAGQLLENIRAIQMPAQLRPSETIDTNDLRLTIEMETGTGKTYTYIKTMYELNKLYGWSKFIIVVPSIAIREGVCRSFDIMSEHFAAEYGKRIQSFIYDSKQLTKIDQFASDSNMHVMIINTQAFAARGEDARRIYMKLDAFRSRKPIDVIAATNPILIIDEPQSVLGADRNNATRNRLKEFHPLFTLLYSATHRADDIVNMVYRLDAMDAYNKKLVKKITVQGINQKGSTATNGFLCLERIELSKGNPRALLGFDKKTRTGTKQVSLYVTDGFDIYQQSGELEEYADGYHVESINGYTGTVRLLNGIELHEGDMVGAINKRAVRRQQIRETIMFHLDKERQLFKRGIKCLSLFFIDHVDNYRIYETGGGTKNGQYAQIFEDEYADIVGSFQLRTDDDPRYIEYLRSMTPQEVHNGYFSRDRKGHFVQPKATELRNESSNDASAYDLIMKDKERLLSFEEPTRFIFSHSALKEGWDNPNVFQICTLKDSDNTTKKRQEVGRGMRLCVNSEGERQDENVLHGEVFKVNDLTVIASESYENFAEKLQTEIAEAVGDRPLKVQPSLFEGLLVTNAAEEQYTLTDDDAQDILFTLRMKGYITKQGQLTEAYHEAKQQGTLDFGDYQEYSTDIVKKLDTVFNPDKVKPKNGRNAQEAHFDKQKFERKEFQELWKKINHKTYYTVDFSTDELIERSIASLDRSLHVSEISLEFRTGTLDNIQSKLDLQNAQAMRVIGNKTISIREAVGNVRYDLIGKLVEATGLTRKAVVAILKGIRPTTFDQFKINPEEFIIKAGNIINECKAVAVIEHVQYHKLDQKFESDIFSNSTLKGRLGENAMESAKSLYDLVVVDSKGIEMNFAKTLEEKNEVEVYTKLPGGFYINTPVGHYNPDWAIVFKEGEDIKHIYFVAETKGSLDETQLRESERSKIECARRHFETIAGSSITYGVVTKYDDLRAIITK